VFNDMTARLDDSFQRIRDFTLHASHELKTPLTVLHGELEAALQDPALPPAHRERCQTQLDEVQRLAAIADGLTLLTKADAGQVPLARKPVPLDELVRDALDDALILARPHGVRVELGTCDAVVVAGDRHRLRQLLLNLTDNAIKYNERDGRVTLALHRAGDAAELTVANTGPGIPPDKIGRVFDRFFRVDDSHNNAVEGCGLGMSIVHWIVTAHGGTIRLRSLPEPLTTVTVRLPVAPVV
jgi:signal transduction histidine kinase